MDRFRIRQGELLGILGPGVLLLVDLHWVTTGTWRPSLVGLWEAGNLILVFAVFMVAYVLGFVLRLIPPDVLDWWSGTLRQVFRSQQVVGSMPDYSPAQAFPYVMWFHYVHEGMEGPKHLSSLKGILSDWYPKEETRAGTELHDKSKFNAHKLRLLRESPELGGEVLYAEGASRMVSGLALAVLIGLMVATWRMTQNVLSAALTGFLDESWEGLMVIWGTAIVLMVLTLTVVVLVMVVGVLVTPRWYSKHFPKGEALPLVVRRGWGKGLLGTSAVVLAFAAFFYGLTFVGGFTGPNWHSVAALTASLHGWTVLANLVVFLILVYKVREVRLREAFVVLNGVAMLEAPSSTKQPPG